MYSLCMQYRHYTRKGPFEEAETFLYRHRPSSLGSFAAILNLVTAGGQHAEQVSYDCNASGGFKLQTVPSRPATS